MSAMSIVALLGVAPRPGAADAEIAAAERDLGAPLPDDYKAFLRESDGIEGLVAGGQDYVMLWRASEIAQHNRGYAVAEFMPQIVLFGSNGGIDAYGFIRQNAERVVYTRIPFLDLRSAEPEPMGGTLVEFVRRLRGLPMRTAFETGHFVPAREALQRARSALPDSSEQFRHVSPGQPGTIGTLDQYDELMEQYEHEVALWALAAVGRAVEAPLDFWAALDDAGRLMGFDEAWRARECRP